MNHRSFALLTLLALLALLALAAPACGGSTGDNAAPPGGGAADAGDDAQVGGGEDAGEAEDAALDAAEPPECEAAVLERQPWVSGDLSGERELWRLPHPDGGCTYAIWYAPARPFPGGNPAVLITDPYNGIDWSGEEVDARWSAAAGEDGAVFQADVDGPGGGPESPGISYVRAAPAQTLELAFIYLVNGLGVMIGYGRFYAGGDLTDDVGDVQAAMAHMATRPGVDPTRLGAWGGSWGGFEAVYSALGPVKPRAVAALAPPIDFRDMEAWVVEGVDALLSGERRDYLHTFFDPYRRRMQAAFARPEGDAPYTHAGVCAKLESDLLLIHDAWDLLVPAAQSRDMAASCPGVDALLVERTTPLDYANEPIDHGPIGRETGYPAQLTFSLTYLLTSLLPDDQSVFTGYDPANLRAWLQLARDAQPLGHDGASLARRLQELCDHRVLAFDLVHGGDPRPGCDVAAEHVNAVWGTSLSPAQLRAQLESGLP